MTDEARLPGAIDLHARFVPPGYRKGCEKGGAAMPDGIPGGRSGPGRAAGPD